MILSPFSKVQSYSNWAATLSPCSPNNMSRTVRIFLFDAFPSLAKNSDAGSFSSYAIYS